MTTELCKHSVIQRVHSRVSYDSQKEERLQT